MGTPISNDSLGLKPDRGSLAFVIEVLEGVIDTRIAQAWRGRTQIAFSGMTDSQLALELIARGWAVFKPVVNDT